MKTKLMCLIIASCTENSEQSRKDIERIIAAVKKTRWNIERITLVEDQRSAL